MLIHSLATQDFVKPLAINNAAAQVADSNLRRGLSLPEA